MGRCQAWADRNPPAEDFEANTQDKLGLVTAG